MCVPVGVGRRIMSQGSMELVVFQYTINVVTVRMEYAERLGLKGQGIRKLGRCFLAPPSLLSTTPRVKSVPPAYDFSPVVGTGWVSVTGLYTAAGLTGGLVCLISFFFGFFFSLRRASRLPMILSSHCEGVATWPSVPVVRRNFLACQFVSGMEFDFHGLPCSLNNCR